METGTSGNDPFVIERVYNASPEKVWQVISDHEKMKEWYFDIPDFKAEVGFEFHFFGGSEEKTYKHLSTVTEVTEGKKLSYTWTYEGYPGYSVVTFEVILEGDKTKLKLTHEGLETFPDQPDFKKESFAMGWTEIIGNILKTYVEKE